MSVKELSTFEEYTNAIKNYPKFTIFFYSTTCQISNKMGEKYAAYGKDYPGIIFGKVDVEKNTETFEKCDIAGTPTFQLYLEGVKQHEILGDKEYTLLTKLKILYDH